MISKGFYEALEAISEERALDIEKILEKVTFTNKTNNNLTVVFDDIEVGIKKVGGDYTVIVNRPEAIRHAITMANNDDTIVIPGLGHDLYLEKNGVKLN